MEYLVIAALLGLIPAFIAKSKGRTSLFGWWLYGFLLFIVAFIHSLCMKDLNNQTANAPALINPKATRPCSNPKCFKMLVGNQTQCSCGTFTPLPEVNDERECPFCAELIKKKASKCKHCGSTIEPLEV